MSDYFNPEKDVVEQCGEGPYYEGQQYEHWDGRIFVYMTTNVFGVSRQDWLPYDYIINQNIGATGAIGLSGPKGFQGDQGETGEPGVAGEQGLTGATGASGPPGEQGPPGILGMPGKAFCRLDERTEIPKNFTEDRGEFHMFWKMGEIVVTTGI